MQNGFHSMEKIVVDHDDHGIIIASTSVRYIVH